MFNLYTPGQVESVLSNVSVGQYEGGQRAHQEIAGMTGAGVNACVPATTLGACRAASVQA